MDTTGLLIRAVVHSADIRDHDGAFLVLVAVYLICVSLKLIWADMGYRGERLKSWMERECDWRIEIVSRPRKWGWYHEDVEPPRMPRFSVLKRQGVVERTIAWVDRYRRLSKDYEYLTESSETIIYLAMSRLMLRRLALNLPYGLPSRQRLGLKH